MGRSPMLRQEVWVEMEEDFDEKRDIARSTYGDMLHDRQRNKQYYEAIKKEVKSFNTSHGRLPYCLDIGTGTGLLSMMACASVVQHITACEGFQPVAEVAKKIIKRNGYQDNITVVSKSSMDTTIPSDMRQKADMVVMELFDTELIGEGLLPSMRHAHQNLLNEHATVVPAAATVYIQLLQSDELWHMHQLSPELTDGCCMNIPSNIGNCKGAPAVFDIQADELNNFIPLTQPTAILRFLFCDLNTEENIGNMNTETVMDTYKENEILKYFNNIDVTTTGTVHVILMWWTLQMDKEGTISLSMAPKWMDKKKIERNEWRDHWMQGIYFLQKPLKANKDDTLEIHTIHDDFTFWFDVKPLTSMSTYSPYMTIDQPLCTCGVHTVWSRPRFAMVNNTERRRIFHKLSNKLLRCGHNTAVVISDGSLLSIIMVKAGFEKVYVLEPEVASRRILQQIIECNNLTDKIVIVPKSADAVTFGDFNTKVDVIVGEPFFLSSLLPWHDLYYWYAGKKITSVLNNSFNVKIYPRKAYLKALGVELKDLWKIKSPLGKVEGFDVGDFDELIMKCSVENEMIEAEPHSMWEYPCKALTNIYKIMEFDLANDVPGRKVQVTGSMSCIRNGRCNAVVLWMDYLVDEDLLLSTGVENELDTTQDGFVKNWVKFYKQGVFFLHKPRDIDNENRTLHYDVIFHPDQGLITMTF